MAKHRTKPETLEQEMAYFRGSMPIGHGREVVIWGHVRREAPDFLRGKWFSELNPNGDDGAVQEKFCVPISRYEFEAAKNRNWRS
jgi:hypothetical protein